MTQQHNLLHSLQYHCLLFDQKAVQHYALLCPSHPLLLHFSWGWRGGSGQLLCVFLYLPPPLQTWVTVLSLWQVQSPFPIPMMIRRDRACRSGGSNRWCCGCLWQRWGCQRILCHCIWCSPHLCLIFPAPVTAISASPRFSAEAGSSLGVFGRCQRGDTAMVGPADCWTID